MFDEPQEDPAERSIDPAAQAKDKSDEFRMHAELCAVFEGPRKFDAVLRPDLDADLARDVQRTMGRLEKAKSATARCCRKGPSTTQSDCWQCRRCTTVPRTTTTSTAGRARS
jgi:hypothetical protein